jgi:hypothetical protein
MMGGVVGNSRVIDLNVAHSLEAYGPKVVDAYWRLRDRHSWRDAERLCWRLATIRTMLAMTFRNGRKHGIKATNTRAPSELFDFIVTRMLHMKPEQI